MSAVMKQIPFGKLMTWVLNEYRNDGSVFGITGLYSHDNTAGSGYYIFGAGPELPIGPAAGPHTQLAQNIIAAYISGARFFELKTVQVLDGEDLPVSKPCINAFDEGYNVEWSTELYVHQALDEYIKGWFAVKLLSRELALGRDDGFVFNMSVGYDLEGIQSKKINSFIEGLKNAENTSNWKTCKQWTYDNLTRFMYVDKHMLDNISPQVSNSITLSTLHGCPPAEIERIAAYLLTEKRLHTFIKCNPTLLGYEHTRSTLDKLGYDYICFDERHFINDLQFCDAVPMLGRLQKLADSLSLEFGVKLTNTFPVQIKHAELPGEEMYMSGRALFPLSIEVACRLSEAFNGKLKISYSGGADALNISDIIDTGIWPVTLATTLLKPGGYGRFRQIAASLSEYDRCADKGNHGGRAVNIDKLRVLAASVYNNRIYRKPAGMIPDRKIGAALPVLDCHTAPCRSGCPFGQDVPAYLRLVSEHKYLEALRVITERNPLPNITGTICSHNCMNKCTRFYVDGSVNIRGAKLEAAQNAYQLLLDEAEKSRAIKGCDSKVAVIGGGPAGLAAAYFLAKTGYPVTLFEEKASLGGVVRYLIPGFRIKDEAIDNDIALVMAMGVDVKLNTKVTDITGLYSDGFKYVIVATGAWVPNKLMLEQGDTLDALAFLKDFKTNLEDVVLGMNVAVIGGGNTAIDAARAAVRVKGVRKVTIVYRRTKRYMPAAAEEIELAAGEGIDIMELTAPVSFIGGILCCNIMTLGEPDSSGRRSNIKTGETVSIPCDTVISAIGSKTEDININEKINGRQDIYIIGDAARGPATIAEAIADAVKCAQEITGEHFNCFEELNANLLPANNGSPDTDMHKQHAAVLDKRGVLYGNRKGIDESKLCLECAAVCNICVEVCPNRANISLFINGHLQIVHIDFMCNECGNCAVFCPYNGAPYLDKLTYYNCKQDFDDGNNPGYLLQEDGTVCVRYNGTIIEQCDGSQLPEDIWQLILESRKKFSDWIS